MFVVGTAGHVDHGKSALVQALTGIDPDRLRAEKERGMTIDLGFAWLRLPGGLEISLVDVPGHERFIKNMLAGVGGIDLALLVVAADEGVMPQTREHLAIIDLLGIRNGVVALSKSDLVDRDWQDLVSADVEETIHGTSLEGSRIVPCSAISREGLPELVAELEAALSRATPKRNIGRPRLWIDRAFTISGFGSVVTGTLVDGTLDTGQEIELLPQRQRARIRGLQMHRQKVNRALPGTRTAVNLANISADALGRGMLLTTPAWLQPSTATDVRLNAVAGMPRPIRHNASVTFHTGSAEIPAKVRLLDRTELAPGESCWAQLRLTNSLPLVKGDGFVIRTPNATVGGGAIVDAHPRRHRRNHPPTLAALAAMERGSPEEALLGLLAKLEPTNLSAIVRETDLSAGRTRELIDTLISDGRVVKLADGGTLLTAEGYRIRLRQGQDILRDFYAEHPLRTGMPREELRSRLGVGAKVFGEFLDRWLHEGEMIESGALVGAPGHSAALTSEQLRDSAAFLAALAVTPFSPPTGLLPEPELLGYLVEHGDVVQVSDDVVLLADAYGEATRRIVGYLHERQTITLAEVRDLLGTSRKYAQAILENLDEERVTRRLGDQRILRAREGTRP